MYRLGESFGGIDGKRILQAGILDDPADLDDIRLDLEMFVKDRRKWIPAFEGLAQHRAMPQPAEK
jgi:hypothetical protein